MDRWEECFDEDQAGGDVEGAGGVGEEEAVVDVQVVGHIHAYAVVVVVA